MSDDVIQVRTLTELFSHERAKRIITPLLPRGVTYEEIYAETAHAVARNPELLECTPMSLIHAIGRAVATGLVIGETVHLVPYNQKVSKKGEPDRWEKRCQKITDYKGEIELIIRSGGARNIYGAAVYANEIAGQHGGKFLYEEGTEPRIVHVPILDPRKRGAMEGAYAVANVTQTLIKTVWVHITRINEIRADSKGWKKLEVTPDWYAMKTAIHALAKVLPKSPKTMAVFRAMDEETMDVPLLEAPAA